MTTDFDGVIAMTDTPDLDAAMARVLAEIAGVRSEADDLCADLTAQKVIKGQMNIMRALQIATGETMMTDVVRFELFCRLPCWPCSRCLQEWLEALLHDFACVKEFRILSR
jgi:hypothetical protein